LLPETKLYAILLILLFSLPCFAQKRYPVTVLVNSADEKVRTKFEDYLSAELRVLKEV
jgi:hypothetical protein